MHKKYQDTRQITEVLSVVSDWEAKEFEGHKHSIKSEKLTIEHLPLNLSGGRPLKLPPYYAWLYDIYDQLDATRGYIGDEHVFMPILPNQKTNSISLIFTRHESFKSVLETMFDCTFTDAETRLLKQLAIGKTVNEAAEDDAVSEQAKKFHLKAIFQKTALNKQTDLVRLTIYSIVSSIGDADDQASGSHEVFWDFCDSFLPAHVRAKVVVDRDGNEHRLLDMGPIDGDPKIVLHSQILPTFSEENFADLERLSLRLIWPLRNGALTAKDRTLGHEEHLAVYRSTIEAALSLVDKSPRPFVGVISGCYYLIDFCLHHPDLISSCLLIGPPLKPVRDSSAAGRLRSGLFSLAKNNQRIMLGLLNFMATKLGNIDKCKHMLLNIYGTCPADKKIIEQEFEDYNGGRQIQFKFTKSVQSIQHDFYAQAHPNWSALAKLNVNFRVINGSDDRIHSAEDLAFFSDLPNCDGVELIEGGGQLLYLEHFKAVMAHIKATL